MSCSQIGLIQVLVLEFQRDMDKDAGEACFYYSLTVMGYYYTEAMEQFYLGIHLCIICGQYWTLYDWSLVLFYSKNGKEKDWG